jgi:hypothetical protein
MTLREHVRQLVALYADLVRREGRDSAEAFVALECAAPHRVCDHCQAVIPSGEVHRHLTFKVGFRTVTSCLPW